MLGKIKAREILGSHPAEPDLRRLLENELSMLKRAIPSTKDEIEELIESQTDIQKQVNYRPGAMALPQTKIRVFTQFSESYVKFLRERLSSL